MLNYSLVYIDKLISTLKQIANGDFDVAIPIENDDEFSYIANHINQMAYDLKKTKEKETQLIHKERLYYLTREKEEQATQKQEKIADIPLWMCIVCIVLGGVLGRIFTYHCLDLHQIIDREEAIVATGRFG